MQKLKKYIWIILGITLLSIGLAVFILSKDKKIPNVLVDYKMKVVESFTITEQFLGDYQLISNNKRPAILNRLEKRIVNLDNSNSINFSNIVDSDEQIANVFIDEESILFNSIKLNNNLEVVSNRLVLLDVNNPSSIKEEVQLDNDEYLVVFQDNPFIITQTSLKPLITNLVDSRGIRIQNEKLLPIDRFELYNQGFVTKENKTEQQMVYIFYEVDAKGDFTVSKEIECDNYSSEEHSQDELVEVCSDEYLITKDMTLKVINGNLILVKDQKVVQKEIPNINVQNQIFASSLSLIDNKYYFFQQNGDTVDLILFEPIFE